MGVIVSDPKVDRLLVQSTDGTVDGLQAELLWSVSYADMVQEMRKTMDVWDTLSSGQRNKLQKLIEDILSTVDVS